MQNFHHYDLSIIIINFISTIYSLECDFIPYAQVNYSFHDKIRFVRYRYVI